MLRFPGQVYYGVSTYNYNYYRDYDTILGRYLESDPIGLMGGANTYGYAGGNPLVVVDPLGLWSPAAHNYFIDEIFGKLNPALVDMIKQGSAWADQGKYQDDLHVFMHHMTSDIVDKQASADAECKYVKDMMAKYENLLGQGKNKEAYFMLGAALHPVMDSTSPVHVGRQSWANIDAWKHGPSPLIKEGLSDAVRNPGPTLDAMTRALNGDLSYCGCTQ